MLSAVAFGLVVFGASPDLSRSSSTIAPRDAFGLFADVADASEKPSWSESLVAVEEDDCDRSDAFSRFELEAPWVGLPEPFFVSGSHVDKRGIATLYEQIPRRWDVSSDYEAYRYPVARYLGWPSVISGYDLDLPNEMQRRGNMRAVGHGGVDLAQTMGAPIAMVPLTHQVGDAVVVYVGPLFGNTVVTRHRLREGGGQHDYVLLFGHLSEAAPEMKRGHVVHAGEVVGLVGDSDSPNLVHLHLEARRVKDGVDAANLFADAVIGQSTVTDPRNVLPLRSPEKKASSCRLRPYRGALGTWVLPAPSPLALAYFR